MKILLASYAFAPSVGGIETVSGLLAKHWTQMGHEVVVATETPAETPQSDPQFRCIRCPDRGTLLEYTRWADVVFQNNISLRLASGLLLVRKPFVVTTQTWLDHGGSVSKRLKRGALRLARRVYISRAVAEHVGLPGTVIPNPFADGVFFEVSSSTQRRDLVAVGRLVSDKGFDLLISALQSLKEGFGQRPQLTIVGGGPEEAPLKALAIQYDVADQITFAGVLHGDRLRACLNEHRIAVIPSRWNEPFGVVALEAIACGCHVIGSDGGGLPEAIGACGKTFPNGNVEKLAECLNQALHSASLGTSATRQAHLSTFRPTYIAERYIELFKERLS